MSGTAGSMGDNAKIASNVSENIGVKASGVDPVIALARESYEVGEKASLGRRKPFGSMNDNAHTASKNKASARENAHNASVTIDTCRDVAQNASHDTGSAGKNA